MVKYESFFSVLFFCFFCVDTQEFHSVLLIIHGRLNEREKKRKNNPDDNRGKRKKRTTCGKMKKVIQPMNLIIVITKN